MHLPILIRGPFHFPSQFKRDDRSTIDHLFKADSRAFHCGHGLPSQKISNAEKSWRKHDVNANSLTCPSYGFNAA